MRAFVKNKIVSIGLLFSYACLCSFWSWVIAWLTVSMSLWKFVKIRCAFACCLVLISCTISSIWLMLGPPRPYLPGRLMIGMANPCMGGSTVARDWVIWHMHLSLSSSVSKTSPFVITK